MDFKFHKYQGTGNDFVIADNRAATCNNLSREQISKLCDRRFGVGADGLLLLQEKPGFDFEMIYYNADGNLGSMCGNGARCIVQFANKAGIEKQSYRFLAADGEHEAIIAADQSVKLKMGDVGNAAIHGKYALIDTGSPHYVHFSKNVAAADVKTLGRGIRNGEAFREKGINVNFSERIDDNLIFVRTYERGVEDETLSCGTGVTAAALAHAGAAKGSKKITVKTPGGMLVVEFERTGETSFNNIWLTGPAKFVFAGNINI